MTPPAPALIGLVAAVALLIGAAAAYHARYRLPRPPIGRYTYPDVLVLFSVVVLAPLGHVQLPRVAVVVVFGLLLLFLTQLALRPVLGRPAWPVSAALCAATAIGTPLGAGALSLVGTDLLLAIGVVAVATLWVQAGMRPGHLALFAALLAGYDLVATTLTGLTATLFAEIAGLPFGPVLLLGTGPNPVGIGLGDLLVLVAFPLAAARYHGRNAGLLAAAAGVAVTAAVAALFRLGVLTAGVPLLVVLGPVVLAQQALWQAYRRRRRAAPGAVHVPAGASSPA